MVLNSYSKSAGEPETIPAYKRTHKNILQRYTNSEMITKSIIPMNKTCPDNQPRNPTSHGNGGGFKALRQRCHLIGIV